MKDVLRAPVGITGRFEKWEDEESELDRRWEMSLRAASVADPPAGRAPWLPKCRPTPAAPGRTTVRSWTRACMRTVSPADAPGPLAQLSGQEGGGS